MASADHEALLERFSRLRRYRAEGAIAPHKPLTVLHALACLQAGQPRIAFRSTETVLTPFLQAHWPSIGTPRVEDPFMRLAGDGFWKLDFEPERARTASGAISAAWLREADATAGFSEEYLAMLAGHPSRIIWSARVLLFDVVPQVDPLVLARSLRLNLDL